MPKLSVIIASYNHEKFIRELIESILSQTFRNFEIIAVDDGSKDRTPDILAEYSDRIKLIKQENKGVINARMRGLKESSGEYACFIDSDDKIAPTRFEKQIKILDNSPEIGLVYADALVMDENGKIIGKFSDIYPPFQKNIVKNLFSKYCFIPAITVTFRRSIFDKTGGLWGGGPNCDYLKWIEIASVSKVFHIPEPLGYWRRHTESVSLNIDAEKNYLEILSALKELRQKNQKVAELTKNSFKRRYGRIYFMIGFFSALEKDFKKARKYFLKASCEFPAAIENVVAFVLSFPIINLFSLPIFKLVYKKIYKWK